MSDDVKIEQPTATVSLPVVGDSKVSSVTMSLSVGSAPSAEVVYHTAKGEVERVFSEDALTTIRELQGITFSPRKEPDSKVFVSSSVSGIQMIGYLVAPTIAHSYGKFEATARVAGYITGVYPLDLSIYDSIPGNVSHQATTHKKYKIDPADVNSGNIIGIIKATVKIIMDGYDATLTATKDEGRKKILSKHHEINNVAVKVLFELLDNSKPINMRHWAELSTYASFRGEIFKRIRMQLQQQTGDFMATLTGLLSDFQLTYVPEWDTAGYIIRADSRFTQDAKSMVVSPLYSSFGTGNRSVVPLAAVTVKRSRSGNVRDKGKKPDYLYDNSRALITYPESVPYGYVRVLPQPFWLVSYTAKYPTSSKGEPDKKSASRSKKGPELTMKVYEGARAESDEAAQKAEKGIINVLKEWAEYMYNDLKYIDSTATLNVPFDVSYEVGNRYEFSIGESKFTGFLSSIHHSATFQDDASARYYTRLGITHIQY